MNLTKTLHILPAGGFSREVAALALSCGYGASQFYDDFKTDIDTKTIEQIPGASAVALAIGSSSERKKIYTGLKPALNFPHLVHPSAILMKPESIHLGKGVIICAGSILTVNIQIGDFVIINLHASVGHDCVLGNFVSLMPGARLSGGVTLEDEVYVGTNASILPGLNIGKGATIGAGAVVTKDVPANTTVAGVPAKPLN